ncbi:hypothetical protein J6T21_00915 [Candidatus Saccharibacteria bacterium]|nr:hypothetical protein [Candidatus Saccharibacteria bacterium]
MEKQYIYLVGVSEARSQSDDVIGLNCEYDNSCPMYAFLDKYEALSKYQEIFGKVGSHKSEDENKTSYSSLKVSPYVICMEIGAKTAPELIEGEYFSPMTPEYMDYDKEPEEESEEE